MPAWDIILNLVMALGAALAIGLLCERIGINAIVGYLFAGIIAGPSALQLVSRTEDVAIMAEIGVALLLFTIGLEFSFRQMRRMGIRLLIGGIISIVAVILIGLGLAVGMGQNLQAALSVGVIACTGSTALVVRVLKDSSELDTTYGRRALGLLLVQDLLLVPLLLLVSFFGSQSGTLMREIGGAFLRTGLLTIALTVFATFVVPRLLDDKLVARNREFPILLSLGTCMASTWAAHELKLSPALGAFVAGALLADSKFADQMRADMMPLKTLFTTIFFVSIGLLVDLQWATANAHLILFAAVGVVLMKVIVTHLSLRLTMPGIVDSLAASFAVAQVGEFSFVLAEVSLQQGSISKELFQGVVSVSVLTLLITPMVVKRANKIARKVAIRLIPLKKLASREREQGKKPRSGHVLLIGYGEAGQAAAVRLHELGQKVLVLDSDPVLTKLAQEHGHDSSIGDAQSAEMLAHVHVELSAGVVVTVPDYQVTRTIAAQCKSLAPHTPVVARARYHVHASAIDVSGADIVADEESLVGDFLAMEINRLAPLPPSDISWRG